MIPDWLKILITIAGICISRTWTALYIKDIVWGKTKPHIYTWIIWFITQSIGVLWMWQWGGGIWVRWPAVGLLGLGIVIFLSIKYGTKDITTLDTSLLIWWLVAVWVYYLTNNPLRSLTIVSMVDIIWYMPSMRKTRKTPHSETLISWIGYCIANMCVILALAEYNINTLLYIGSILCCNTIMITIIILRRRIAR